MTKRALIALAIPVLAAACLPGTPPPPVSPSYAHDSMPITRDEVLPGTMLRVHAGSSVAEGQFAGSWNRTFALRLRDGRMLEVSSFDSLFIARRQVHPLFGAVAGALLGWGLSTVARSSGTFDLPSNAGALAGTVLGIGLATRAGTTWNAVTGRRREFAVDPLQPAIRERAAPADARRTTLDRVPDGSLVRVAGNSGILEGYYAGVWNDSLRLVGFRPGIPADSVRVLWTRTGRDAPVIGAVLVGLAGLVGSLFYGAYHFSDYDDAKWRLALLVGALGGGMVGYGIGSSIAGWRQLVP